MMLMLTRGQRTEVEIPATVAAATRTGRRDSRHGRRGDQDGQAKLRAAALLLSLWALFLLSAMVISWAVEIDSRLALSGNANRVLEAEAMACSGAEVALHPNI